MVDGRLLVKLQHTVGGVVGDDLADLVLQKLRQELDFVVLVVLAFAGLEDGDSQLADGVVFDGEGALLPDEGLLGDLADVELVVAVIHVL